MNPTPPPGAAPAALPPASPTDLFLVFNGLALRGFGGVLPFAQRTLVEDRAWMSNDEFVEMLALAQVLPGPNICNLALMVGDRFFGLRGAFAALAGMIAALCAQGMSLEQSAVAGVHLHGAAAADRRAHAGRHVGGQRRAGDRHGDQAVGLPARAPARLAVRRRGLRDGRRAALAADLGAARTGLGLDRGGLAPGRPMSTADLLELFTRFLLFSLLAIGGGITVVPEMHRLMVEQQHWLTDAQFTSSIALAQAAPGPNVLFVALMGWNVGLNAGGGLGGGNLGRGGGGAHRQGPAGEVRRDSLDA